MHKLLRLAAMEWSMMLQYRTDLILWTLADAASPLITLSIWYKVSTTASIGLTSQETVTYFILVMFVTLITSAWGGFFLANDILNGNIVQFIIRPFSIFWHHIEQNLVEKTLKLLLPLTLFILILFFFPSLFSPAMYNLTHILLFIPSLILATATAFVLDIALGTLAFWLENANQIRGYRYMLETVTSGKLIPFAVLPPLAVSIFSFLPFRYIISVPIEILLGQAEGKIAWQLMGYQTVWFIILTILLTILWKKGLKRYAVPGQ